MSSMDFGCEGNYRWNNFDCTKPCPQSAQAMFPTNFAGQIEPKPMTVMALSVLSLERTVCYPKSPLG